jgi:hypothetical protein
VAIFFLCCCHCEKDREVHVEVAVSGSGGPPLRTTVGIAGGLRLCPRLPVSTAERVL